MIDAKVLLSSSPSQVINIGSFIKIIMGQLILAFGVYHLMETNLIESYLNIDFGMVLLVQSYFTFMLLLWTWLKVSVIEYKIVGERLSIKSGVFNRITDELELYRVKDYGLSEPFFLRLFGLGNLTLQTSDSSSPVVILEAIGDGQLLLSKIRHRVEKLRKTKGVREID